MKHIILVAAVLSLAPFSFAYDEQTFCSDYVQYRENKKVNPQKIKASNVLGFFLKYSFNKKSILLNVTQNQPQDSLDPSFSTYIIGNRGSEAQFLETKTNYLKSRKLFINQRKEVLPLLKDVNTVDQCLNVAQTNRTLFKSYLYLYQNLLNNQKTYYDIENDEIEQYTEKQEWLNQSNNHKKVTIDVLEKGLRTETNQTVVLILHADAQGKLYDSDWNYLPKSVFSNLSHKIKSIVIYTCHAENVFQYYQLEKLKNVRVYYPVVGESSNWLLGTTVPITLLKNYLKGIVSLRKIYSNETSNHFHDSSCTVDLRSIQLETGSLGFFINNEFVGSYSANSTDRTLVFPCSLLGHTNKITVQSLNLFESVRWKALAQSSSLMINQTPIQLEHLYDQVEYVGSTAVFTSPN